MAQNKKAPVETAVKINEYASSSKQLTYKECLVKGVDPLDGEYIDLKIDEKMEEARNTIKGEIKEVVLKELQVEFYEKFYNLKKEYEEKFEKFKKEYYELNDFSQFMNEDDENKSDVKMDESQNIE